MKSLLPLILLSMVLVCGACSEFGYYSQSIGGHLAIMSKRERIETVLSDPARPEKLKRELQTVLDVRRFAEEFLHLPAHASFRTYAEIDRPYAVWNVVAAPAYSLAAYEWCFPVTGCLPYRGYFRKAAAERFADSLRARGLDVYVYGVPAYSTLGWFDDPVLSTFVNYPDWALAGLIFHELAHQIVYAENDGDFNEAFASALEQEGVLRWMRARRPAAELEMYLLYQRRDEDFYRLIADTRSQLLACYDGRTPFDLGRRKQCKDAAFAAMQDSYRTFRQGWGDGVHYDRWFDPGLNNARFISAHTYRFYIPAFAELLRQKEGDLVEFYRAARSLAALSPTERRKEMAALLEASNSAISETSRPPASPPGEQLPKS